MARPTIRPATAADDDALARIAAAGGADTPPEYLAHLRAAGTLLAAVRNDSIVALGGVVPVGDVVMVTDLFVDPPARGAGLGALVLGHLLDGSSARMTCSSQHPAALPVYTRHGMRPRGQLRYYRGHAVGGGQPLRPAAWQHDRADLVAMWAACGAVVTADAVVQRVAEGGVAIHRVVSGDGVATVRAVLAALPPSTEVTLCVPDWQPLGEWLLSNRFDRFDHDIWCATDGVQPDANLAVMHPGLW